MKNAFKRAPGVRRPVAMAMMAAALSAGSAAGAQAQDGVAGFFQQLFGAPAAPVPQPLPQSGLIDPGPAPTLTVRKHRRPATGQLARTHRYTPEELKTVTIYTDRTLVRGDAVMTEGGVRIFNGSSAWPHAKSDFVAISDSSRMPKDVRKELTAIDTASRSDFRAE